MSDPLSVPSPTSSEVVRCHDCQAGQHADCESRVECECYCNGQIADLPPLTVERLLIDIDSWGQWVWDNADALLAAPVEVWAALRAAEDALWHISVSDVPEEHPEETCEERLPDDPQLWCPICVGAVAHAAAKATLAALGDRADDWVRCPHADDHSLTGGLCDICELPRPAPVAERVGLTSDERHVVNGGLTLDRQFDARTETEQTLLNLVIVMARHADRLDTVLNASAPAPVAEDGREGLSEEALSWRHAEDCAVTLHGFPHECDCGLTDLRARVIDRLAPADGSWDQEETP